MLHLLFDFADLLIFQQERIFFIKNAIISANTAVGNYGHEDLDF